MKTITLTSVLLALNVAVFATVWRVNPTPGSSAHFTTLQAAHDNASVVNGDTLYFEGSAFPAGSIAFYKKLTIIGSGYFLSENPQTQFNQAPSIIDGYVYFYNGSQGSQIIGCTFQNGAIYIYTDEITLERNYFNFWWHGYYIYATGNVSDISILSNYIKTSAPGSWSILYFPNSHSNILISNNYLEGIVSTSTYFTGMFTNNIFNGPVTVYNSTLINNIAITTPVTLDNCVTSYNIGTSTQFGNENGNLENVPLGSIFVGLSGNSTDGQWQLKEGSPAIGAGEGGADCGIFDGAYPYVLSGLPPIPAIYDLNSQSLPGSTLNVNLKAKSHN